MTVHDTPALVPEEKGFVERLAGHFSPPPMTTAERVAFDELLQSRLVRRRPGTLKPLAVAATVAALGAWFVLHYGSGPHRTGQALREIAGQRETVGDALLVLALDESISLDRDEELPEEYVAISALLNDG